MAFVVTVTVETSNEFDVRINERIKGKSINEFTIQYQMTENYPNGATARELERLYSALIIFKDDIETSNNFKPKHNNKFHYKNPYNKVHYKEG